MTTFDLSGAWKGHYLQNGRAHAITMRVVHKGQSLMGSMHDEETMWISHDELATDRPGEDAPPPRPIDVLTVLPPESTIEGDVDGRSVSFCKRYRGTHSFTLLIGDDSVSAELEGHRVWYRGELDQSGSVLRGEWSIPPFPIEDDGDSDQESDDEAVSDRGAFELHRERG
ncbi:MAG: hypothetical protein ABL997_15650 [Planctomycetota bacterium]